MTTNRNEAKAMTKRVSCDFKLKFNNIVCNWNQNWIIKHVNMNLKIIVRVENIRAGILAHLFVRIVSI